MPPRGLWTPLFVNERVGGRVLTLAQQTFKNKAHGATAAAFPYTYTYTGGKTSHAMWKCVSSDFCCSVCQSNRQTAELQWSPTAITALFSLIDSRLSRAANGVTGINLNHSALHTRHTRPRPAHTLSCDEWAKGAGSLTANVWLGETADGSKPREEMETVIREKTASHRVSQLGLCVIGLTSLHEVCPNSLNKEAD